MQKITQEIIDMFLAGSVAHQRGDRWKIWTPDGGEVDISGGRIIIHSGDAGTYEGVVRLAEYVADGTIVAFGGEDSDPADTIAFMAHAKRLGIPIIPEIKDDSMFGSGEVLQIGSFFVAVMFIGAGAAAIKEDGPAFWSVLIVLIGLFFFIPAFDASSWLSSESAKARRKGQKFRDIMPSLGGLRRESKEEQVKKLL